MIGSSSYKLYNQIANLKKVTNYRRNDENEDSAGLMTVGKIIATYKYYQLQLERKITASTVNCNMMAPSS